MIKLVTGRVEELGARPFFFDPEGVEVGVDVGLQLERRERGHRICHGTGYEDHNFVRFFC